MLVMVITFERCDDLSALLAGMGLMVSPEPLIPVQPESQTCPNTELMCSKRHLVPTGAQLCKQDLALLVQKHLQMSAKVHNLLDSFLIPSIRTSGALRHESLQVGLSSGFNDFASEAKRVACLHRRASKR